MYFLGLLCIISLCFVEQIFAGSGVLRCQPLTLKTGQYVETRDGISFNRTKVSDMSAKLEFTYQLPSTENFDLEWLHNKEHLKIPEGEVGHLYYEHKSDEKKIVLNFKNPTAKYSGEYVLRLLSKTSSNQLVNATCMVSTQVPMVDMSYETVRETEGSPAVLFCKSSSYPKPKRVHWFFYEKDQMVKLDTVKNTAYSVEHVDGIENSKLKINNLTASDEGFYLCKMDNYYSQFPDSSLFVLRVRNPNAVYWPLIGIAIEVAILFITILVYELKQRDRRKKEKATEDKALAEDAAAQPLIQDNNDKNVRI